MTITKNELSPAASPAVPSRRREEMIQALKQSGHRLTPQRLAILEILAQSSEHPSAEQIQRQVAERFPTTSLATIYKTLTLLKELGQVLELGFAEWDRRYDGRHPQPHPHLICTRCGAILDSESASLERLARQLAAESGFKITHHRLDFFGLCPRCQGKI